MKVTQNRSNTVTMHTQKASSARDRALKAFMGASGGSATISEAAADTAVETAQSENTPGDAPVSSEPAAVEASSTDSGQILEGVEAPAQSTPALDAAPPEEPPQKTEDPALSRQFAQLARQERAMRQKAQQQEQALKAREDALKAREDALGIDRNDKYIPKDRLKQDPLSVLSEVGLSYDDVVNQVLNQQPQDPRMQAMIQRLESEIAELKSDRDSFRKSSEEQQQAQYQAAVKQIETEAKKLIYTDPAFETVKAMNATADVVELITETYNKDGILLSVEEAAQQVEDYLVEEALKLAKLDKIQKRLKPEVASKPAQSQVAQKTQAASSSNQGQTPQMKTLTNQNSTSRKMTARERAIAAITGQLK